MTLETFVLDVMDGKRPGRFFLKALSYLYQSGVVLRNFAYDYNLIRAVEAKIPVVSIGNIVAGGTGKTPLVRLLGEILSSEIEVAILSRGYRSEVEKSNQVVKISSGDTAQKCGDEPFWLSQVLPKVSVWVGKNRSLSASFAKEAGAQVLILDDGMQYRKLKRDFEIVVMDGDDLFGKGHFLPRGLLRDTPRRLESADLVVINQAKDYESIKGEVAKYTKAPLVFVRMHTESDLKGKKVGVFCAIGRPDRFMQAVRDAGAEVVATYFKPDHDPFDPKELDGFARRSGAALLVCTEKDYVKLPPGRTAAPATNFPWRNDAECDFFCRAASPTPWQGLVASRDKKPRDSVHFSRENFLAGTAAGRMPIVALKGSMKVVDGKEHWDGMIERLKRKIDERRI